MAEQDPEIVIPFHTSSFPFHLTPTGVTPPAALRSGIFVFGTGILPPSPANEVLFTGTFAPITLLTDNPPVVQLQSRQSINRDLGYPDQFALQVIETNRNSMLVKIKRLDQGGGWGQHLQIDLLIVDVILGPPP